MFCSAHDANYNYKNKNNFNYNLNHEPCKCMVCISMWKRWWITSPLPQKKDTP